MAERNVETEAKAVDKLVEWYDATISRMANNIASSGYPYGCLNDDLDRLDTIERALSRLLNPLLKP